MNFYYFSLIKPLENYLKYPENAINLFYHFFYERGNFLGHLVIFLELFGLENNFYRLFAYRRKIRRFAQNPSVSVVKLNTDRDYSRNNILIKISWCYTRLGFLSFLPLNVLKEFFFCNC